MLPHPSQPSFLSFQDCVLGALTKDKKRVLDVEVEVSVAWQSTLYVTNFPEKTDDVAIKSMFGKVRPSCLSPRSISSD